MKYTRIIATLLFAICFSISANAQGDQMKIETQLDSVTYVLGGQLVSFFGEDLEKINFDILKAGALDSKNGINKLEGVNIDQIMQAYMNGKVQAVKSEGEEWLAENAKKEGIVVTASGLQYEVMEEGTGAKPLATDKVEVHYHGTLINGTVFDSSVERGEAISFPLNGVIPGWTEGVQLMKTGAKYRFYIPSELAYGERGQGAVIPPYSVLIFEVQLISIEDKAPAAAQEK